MLNLMVVIEDPGIELENKEELVTAGSYDWLVENKSEWKEVTLEDGLAELDKFRRQLVEGEGVEPSWAEEWNNTWVEKSQGFLDQVTGRSGKFLIWWDEEMNDKNMLFMEDGETL